METPFKAEYIFFRSVVSRGKFTEIIIISIPEIQAENNILDTRFPNALLSCNVRQ